MKRFSIAILVWSALVLVGWNPAGAGSPNQDFPITPNPDKTRIFRIGYMQGGDYKDYLGVMKAIAKHLAVNGWIRPEKLQGLDQAQTAGAIWNILSAKADGDYLIFVRDAFWSAGWNPELRKKNRQAFLERVKGRDDLDLMLALGTWAGQDLACKAHEVPVVICSTSDAVAAGIIKSPEDSGLDHVNARVDPTRYARQVRLFHDAVRFKTLGVVLEDTPEGRSYAGLPQIEAVAKERGFKIVKCHAPLEGVDQAQCEAEVNQCYRKLAPQVDAMYITNHRGVNRKNMPRILAPLFEYRVPNFAMGTLYEVEYGAMMSMAQPDFDYAGAFYARTMARILNGARPRDLNQVLEDPHAISINLEAAKKIGFDFSLEILGGADVIVERISEDTD